MPAWLENAPQVGSLAEIWWNPTRASSPVSFQWKHSAMIWDEDDGCYEGEACSYGMLNVASASFISALMHQKVSIFTCLYNFSIITHISFFSFFTTLVHTLTPAFSTHFNLSLLSPTGLQHPRQRRPALSGTLQSTPRPPRAGNYSNAPVCWWAGVIGPEVSGVACVALKAAELPPQPPSRRYTGLPWLWITCTVTSSLVICHWVHVNRQYCGYAGMGGCHGRNVLGLSSFSPAGEKVLHLKKKCWKEQSCSVRGRFLVSASVNFTQSRVLEL